MTVQEVLAKVDVLKPSRFDRPMKLTWLAQIEGQIFHEIVCTHESPPILPPHIDKDCPPDYELIAPFPYDDVYVLWLECQIDYGNHEINKYNNDRTLFNNALMTLRDFWNRTYMPKERVHNFHFNERPHPYDGHRLYSRQGPLGE